MEWREIEEDGKKTPKKYNSSVKKEKEKQHYRIAQWLKKTN